MPPDVAFSYADYQLGRRLPTTARPLAGIMQKHETIGFKEYVRKSTSRIQEKPIKQTIDNILSNAAKSRMSAMTAEYNKLILETKGAL